MAASRGDVWRAVHCDHGRGGAAHRHRRRHGRGDFGQLTMSMLIDNFGWLGNAAIPFSMSRLAAVLCPVLRCFSFTQAVETPLPTSNVTPCG